MTDGLLHEDVSHRTQPVARGVKASHSLHRLDLTKSLISQLRHSLRFFHETLVGVSASKVFVLVFDVKNASSVIFIQRLPAHEGSVGRTKYVRTNWFCSLRACFLFVIVHGKENKHILMGSTGTLRACPTGMRPCSARVTAAICGVPGMLQRSYDLLL